VSAAGAAHERGEPVETQSAQAVRVAVTLEDLQRGLLGSHTEHLDVARPEQIQHGVEALPTRQMCFQQTHPAPHRPLQRVGRSEI
jgi:hypothetical protein